MIVVIMILIISCRSKLIVSAAAAPIMTAQSLPVISSAAILIFLNDSCSCNLHGQFCTIVNGTTACECSHFTTGVSCERCLPLYNNRTWQPGSYLPYPTGSANECQSKSRVVANKWCQWIMQRFMVVRLSFVCF